MKIGVTDTIERIWPSRTSGSPNEPQVMLRTIPIRMPGKILLSKGALIGVIVPNGRAATADARGA